MNAKLCSLIPESFISSTSIDNFFGETSSRLIRKFEESREKSDAKCPAQSCKTNLFFGFFFDGTKNNDVNGQAAGNQSNIARLYDCYPGKSVETVLPKDTDWTYNAGEYVNFFRAYAPGVASEFSAIKDSGKGDDLYKGGAFGFLGEDRIKWMLIQALNNIHRYFYGTPLLSPE